MCFEDGSPLTPVAEEWEPVLQVKNARRAS